MKLITLLEATKKDFAAALGVSAAYITQLTTKEGKEPSPSFTKLIARTFGISEKWLSGEMEEDNIFGYEVSSSQHENMLDEMRTKFRRLIREIAFSPIEYDERIHHPSLAHDYIPPEVDMFKTTLAGRSAEEKLQLMAEWLRLVQEFDGKRKNPAHD